MSGASAVAEEVVAHSAVIRVDGEKIHVYATGSENRLRRAITLFYPNAEVVSLKLMDETDWMLKPAPELLKLTK